MAIPPLAGTLSHFVAVGRHKHSTRAAEEIGVAQPALSQQVRLLERELGTPLLDRTTRRVRLTPAGVLFLQRAEQILADVSQAQADLQELAGLMRGRVTVGVIPSLEEEWLPTALTRFHLRHRNVELAVREETTVRLKELLRQGSVDFAVIIDDGKSVPELSTARLFTEPLIVAAAVNHPLGAAGHVQLKELRDETWVVLKPEAAVRQMIVTAAAVAGFAPRIIGETSSVQTLRALVAAGLGITLLPRSVASRPGPEIATIEVGQPALHRAVAAAWRTDTSRPTVAVALLEQCLAACGGG